MLDPSNIPEDFIASVKRHLNITWSDSDTDAKVREQMLDAEIALNEKLGASPDYFAPGAERRLYLDYMLYSWNNCLDEFDDAYMENIYQLRRKYEVAQMQASQKEAADDS